MTNMSYDFICPHNYLIRMRLIISKMFVLICWELVTSVQITVGGYLTDFSNPK